MKTTNTPAAMDRPTPFATFVRSCCLAVLLVAAGCARPPGVSNPTACGIESPSRQPRLLAIAAADEEVDETPDYDPWQPFNEKMFFFNHEVLDRFLMKPAATGWSKVTPAVVRRSIARLFNNLEMPRRVVNNLLQARPLGAGRELARFAVNSTIGLGGLLDVATKLDIEPSNADAGETLALYGAGPGPYLVLPTFPPLTVRDAIGRGIDGALDPIGYVLPFFANRAKSFVSAVNERSLNLKLYADVEDSVIDLYSAARNGYLQRRREIIRRATADRDAQWQWAFEPSTPDTPLAVATAGPTSEETEGAR
jgi:phospholipid-binding lipoprotein MlaA